MSRREQDLEPSFSTPPSRLADLRGISKKQNLLREAANVVNHSKEGIQEEVPFPSLSVEASITIFLAKPEVY